MNLDKYTFDELDLEFILYVKDELEKRIGNEAIPVLLGSDFFDRLKQAPLYVHHYDEMYWADYVLSRCESSVFE